jgi:hypothetical protein
LDVPYYIFPYDPSLELRCLTECQALCHRLKAKGYPAEVISLATWLVDALDRLGCLDDHFGYAQCRGFLKHEAADRAMIQQDLERELPKLLSERLCAELGDKPLAFCAVLVRLGALFPFVHISTLLSAVEGHVGCTLVVPYPGSVDGEMLRFLNETESSYYRAEVI